MSDNKRIAKNTIVLYLRMIITMVVTLYTSRVVLQQLGVDDYGIFQTVGGVIVMFSFVSNALSSASSRFLTFELGTGDFEKLKRTFNSIFVTHLILGIIICILAATIAPYFITNKLDIDPNRIDAALWVLYFSIFSTFVSIIQVPFTATIVAHEKMSAYAYLLIIDSLLKLLIAYFLKIGDCDKITLYGFLLFCVIFIITLCYVIYCLKKFKESRVDFKVDKDIIKNIFGFSSWSLLASSSIALNAQGINIITSIFFGPAVVTARAISIQGRMAAEQFITNFRMATNPQIIKLYAAGNQEGSKKLLLNSTIFSYFLMLLIGLPIIFVAEPLLKLWLGIVPGYTVIFLQLIIIESLFSVFDTSFYTALYTKGRLKENVLISPIIGFVRFPIVYIFFELGYSPVVLSYAGVISYALLGLFIKPYLVCKIVGYKLQDILSVFVPCIKVTIVAIALPIIYYLLYYNTTIISSNIIMISISILSTVSAIYLFGVNRELRGLIVDKFKNYFKIRIQ